MKLLMVLGLVLTGCAGEPLYLAGVGMQGFAAGMDRQRAYYQPPVQVYPQYNPLYSPVFNPVPIPQHTYTPVVIPTTRY